MAVTDYLNGQIKAGAQAIQIFDTWGGALSGNAYREFSLNYMEKIISGLIKENEGRKVPVIMFTKNGGQWLEDMADSGADALGLDWTIEIGSARARVGHRVALQGNMDPNDALCISSENSPGGRNNFRIIWFWRWAHL